MESVLLRVWVLEYLCGLFDGAVQGLPRPPAGTGNAPWAAAAHAMAAVVARQQRDEIAADYTRLFVNAPAGVPAPPYASWYLDGTLLGPAADAAARMYAAQGLEHAADDGEPADHVAVELEFLLFLTRHELAARTTDDAAALAAVLEAERAFVIGHMARWIPAFVAHARRARPGGAYAAALQVLEAVLADDIWRLSGVSNPGASGRPR